MIGYENQRPNEKAPLATSKTKHESHRPYSEEEERPDDSRE